MNAENIVKIKVGEKTYNDLDNKQKQMLIDFSFNLGPNFMREFPKFVEGVLIDDIDVMKKEHFIMKVNVNDLMNANPGVDPKKLQTGQKLNLP